MFLLGLLLLSFLWRLKCHLNNFQSCKSLSLENEKNSYKLWKLCSPDDVSSFVLFEKHNCWSFKLFSLFSFLLLVQVKVPFLFSVWLKRKTFQLKSIFLLFMMHFPGFFSSFQVNARIVRIDKQFFKAENIFRITRIKKPRVEKIYNRFKLHWVGRKIMQRQKSSQINLPQFLRKLHLLTCRIVRVEWLSIEVTIHH